jgi:hypothetical protein
VANNQAASYCCGARYRGLRASFQKLFILRRNSFGFPIWCFNPRDYRNAIHLFERETHRNLLHRKQQEVLDEIRFEMQ